MLTSLQRFTSLVESRRQTFDELTLASSLGEVVAWAQTNQLLGFNRSAVRLKIMHAIARTFRATHFVETGTYHAATTICARRCLGLPTWSCELSRSRFSVARTVTAGMTNVKLARLDSRSFLAKVTDELRGIANVHPIFYLDAHDDGGASSTQCPLLEEMALVLKLASCVVVVDDFQVPGGEFTYRRYGGLDLSIESIHRTLFSFGVRRVFLPDYPASLETGHGRAGFMVFCRSATLERAFRTGAFPFSLLRPCELS